MKRMIGLIWLSLFVFACQATNQISLPAITPTVAAVEINNPTPTITNPPTLPDAQPTTTNTLVPTVTPNPTETPAPSPSPGATPQLNLPPTNWIELESWLLAARSEGNPPASVGQLLRESSWQQEESDFQIFDLDGDEVDEWLLTLYVTALPDYTPLGNHTPGQFWILGDAGILYAIDLTNQELFEGAPIVTTVADFTGDSIYDVITSSTACGAHTCYQFYRAISHQNDTWKSIIKPQNLDAPEVDDVINISYSEAETFDYTENGVYDFMVHGGTIGSAGAGIHRGYSEVWGWDGEWLTQVDLIWDESNYRHHRLYDANIAFENGEIGLAKELYLNVINNDLEDVFSWVDPEQDTYHAARKLAAFRLVLLGLQENDMVLADEWLTWLKINYQNNTLTQAAAVLMDSWNKTNDLVESCARVLEFVTPIENAAGAVAYLGYGNPEITNEDICPIPKTEE